MIVVVCTHRMAYMRNMEGIMAGKAVERGTLGGGGGDLEGTVGGRDTESNAVEEIPSLVHSKHGQAQKFRRKNRD